MTQRRIKRMDLDEFRQLGLLQEVNRQFFHPLGLALEVIVQADGRVSGFGGVWDFRADPEGMAFRDEDLDETQAEVVAAMRQEKAEARRKLFGAVVQPIPLSHFAGNEDALSEAVQRVRALHPGAVAQVLDGEIRSAEAWGETATADALRRVRRALIGSGEEVGW